MSDALTKRQRDFRFLPTHLRRQPSNKGEGMVRIIVGRIMNDFDARTADLNDTERRAVASELSTLLGLVE